MTAREFLERPYNLYKKLQYLEKARQHYTELMYSVRSINYSEPKVDKSPSNTTPNMYGIMMLDETEEKIKVTEEEYDKACKEVYDKINELESDEIKLMMRYKYLEFKSLNEIADELYVSRTTIKRWHREVINMLIV